MKPQKHKFSDKTNEELLELRSEFQDQLDLARPILQMNPIPAPIKDYIKLRDAALRVAQDLALVSRELAERGLF